MKNLNIKVKGDKLIIEIDLTKKYGYGRSGKTEVVCSTDGSLPLHDGKDYRDEVLNCSVYRKLPREKWRDDDRV